MRGRLYQLKTVPMLEYKYQLCGVPLRNIADPCTYSRKLV